MHYSDQPAALEGHEDRAPGVMWFRGGGIVTASMVQQVFSRLTAGADNAPNLLIDLREVAGYDAQAVAHADRLLADAHAAGVRRIAFVADSPAVHTAARVVSSRGLVPLRTFHHERSAREWLAG